MYRHYLRTIDHHHTRRPLMLRQKGIDKLHHHLRKMDESWVQWTQDRNNHKSALVEVRRWVTAKPI